MSYFHYCNQHKCTKKHTCKRYTTEVKKWMLNPNEQIKCFKEHCFWQKKTKS